ncbi:unnamed protein product [Trichobilharzia szidati]|nr:unnamed protein product [Trichobilharzia szidati]
MFFEFIALIVLCGSNGVIGDERDQILLVKPKAAESNLFCEFCTSAMNATKYILDTDPLLPYIYKYLDQICDLFPENYQEKCHDLVHGGLVEKLHQWIDQIDIYKFCAKVGLCNSTRSSSDSSDELSRINEPIEYALTYLMNPQYVETASEELCRTYAGDFNECKDTLMMLANHFIKMPRQLLDVF